jgi:hypothetical protein
MMMVKKSQVGKSLLSVALIGLTLSSSCVSDLEGGGDEPLDATVSEATSEIKTRPNSDCTKQKFAQAGVTAASAVPFIGTGIAVLSDLIDFTSFFGSCGVTIEDVMRISKTVANEAIVSFAKSELAAIDKLIQSDQTINLPKLEARYTTVFTKIGALADMDHTTTPIVVAAATVAMTLEMMKLKVAFNQRRGYVEEAKALAKTTIRQFLNKKKDQFNTYWNRSTAVVKGPYVYPFAVPYNEATITYPDGSKEVARRNYRTPTEAAQGKAAYQSDTNALLASRRKAAYDELFTNAPFQTLWNSLDRYYWEAHQHYSLAYRRPTAQSSYYIPPQLPTSGYAVDGYKDDRRTAATTTTEANPWWRVDLGRDTDGRAIPINGINVNFRSGTRRWRAVVELLGDDGRTVVWAGSIDSTSAGPHALTTGHKFGRYVRLRLINGDKLINLSELYVWPPIPPAR